MSQAALVTLNMRELDRLKVIQAVVDLGLKPGRAAGRLGLSVRQVERLVARYRESGAAGLASRKRKSPGNRKLDEGQAVRALTIIRERYADFGPTLACEKLRECHGIRLARCDGYLEMSRLGVPAWTQALAWGDAYHFHNAYRAAGGARREEYRVDGGSWETSFIFQIPTPSSPKTSPNVSANLFANKLCAACCGLNKCDSKMISGANGRKSRPA
jgi:transposase